MHRTALNLYLDTLDITGGKNAPILFDENEAFYPVEVGMLDAAGIMFAANGVLYQIEENITPCERDTLIIPRKNALWEYKGVNRGRQL